MSGQVVCRSSPLLKHLLILFFNVGNVILYFHSNNEFAKDMGWKDRFEIQDLGDFVSAKGFFLVFAGLSTFISNQRATYSNFSNALDTVQGDNLEYGTFDRPKEQHVLPFLDSTLTASYKSVTIALQATTLIKQIFNIDDYLSQISVLIASLFFIMPGSLFSELAVYTKPFIRKSTVPVWIEKKISSFFDSEEKRRKFSKWLSHFLAVTFNLGETALYFNGFDKMLTHFGSELPISRSLNSWVMDFLFGYMVLSSGSVLGTIQQKYSDMILEILENRRIQHDDEKERCPGLSNLSAANVVLYKSIIATAGIMSIVYSATAGDWLATGLVGGGAFLGSLGGQFAVFFSKQKKVEQSIDEPQEDGLQEDDLTETNLQRGSRIDPALI